MLRNGLADFFTIAFIFPWEFMLHAFAMPERILQRTDQQHKGLRASYSNLAIPGSRVVKVFDLSSYAYDNLTNPASLRDILGGGTWRASRRESRSRAYACTWSSN